VANHKSAMKRVRQTARRRTRNRHVLTTMRTHIKHLRAAVEAGNAEDAKTLLTTAVRELSRAADKGVIHRGQASRKIGRLTRAVNGLG
jgi:small subunit ribosomal protein S20